MTLAESNQMLAQIDCRDPLAVADALTQRSRAIVEFAASAPKELLDETLKAGEIFRDRLEMAQIETRRELSQMTQLSRGLESTLSEPQTDHITCFG